MTGIQTVFPSGQTTGSDVRTPQVENLLRLMCLSVIRSDMVGTGRRIKALMSYRGRSHAGAPEAPQERWRRGCRRADVSLWFSLWLLRWLLAPKKKKSWLRRSPSSQPTPASTSDLPARARQPWLTGPAPISGPRPLVSGAIPKLGPKLSDAAHWALWDSAAVWHIRPVTGADKGQDSC